MDLQEADWWREITGIRERLILLESHTAKNCKAVETLAMKMTDGNPAKDALVKLQREMEQAQAAVETLTQLADGFKTVIVWASFLKKYSLPIYVILASWIAQVPLPAMVSGISQLLTTLKPLTE